MSTFASTCLLDVPEPQQLHAQRIAVVRDRVVHVPDAVHGVEHAARVLRFEAERECEEGEEREEREKRRRES